jgi:tetrahydromethanopterin S-methyltransferase subunit C
MVWNGPGAGAGVAVGLLFGMLLVPDWRGPVVGAVLGLIVGAIADGRART